MTWMFATLALAALWLAAELVLAPKYDEKRGFHYDE